ncbi:hypothetical protein PR202_gb29226 [Eleusine coracana subsp. coracana]|uniref:CUE domain-containing protein n=1 Tax=Eleusine coracana subsp. coracana TaxID=191504 RepID=A0AAV5FWN9_ELECO|nr:hypothetical protein PR202_gb29226 [Eleusine coracana subsp. coracana]
MATTTMKKKEEYTIAVVDFNLPPQQVAGLLHAIRTTLSMRYLETAVSGFWRMLQWIEGPRARARVLVEVMFDSVLTVPRSLVLRLGVEWGGQGRSWIVPVYVLNNDFLDVQPGDEDLPPPDNGNPHPFEDNDPLWNIQLHHQDQYGQQEQQPGNQVWPNWDQVADQGQAGQAAPAASVHSRLVPGGAPELEAQFGTLGTAAQLQASQGTEMNVDNQEQAKHHSPIQNSLNIAQVAPNAAVQSPPIALDQDMEVDIPEHNLAEAPQQPIEDNKVAAEEPQHQPPAVQPLNLQHFLSVSFVAHQEAEQGHFDWPDFLPAAPIQQQQGDEGNMHLQHEVSSQGSATMPSISSFNNWSMIQHTNQNASVTSRQQELALNQEFREILQDVLRQHSKANEQIRPGQAQTETIALANNENLTDAEQVQGVRQATQNQDMGILSQRNVLKDRVYRRKRFCMFKFVHNRIIEITYQRKNKHKKRKSRNKASTPITTAGLRRSSRMTELNEGHRSASVPSNAAPLRSQSQQEGLNAISSLAGIHSLPPSESIFAGPIKFPSEKEIDESITPFPEIPIQALQQIAVECGLHPEEVATELLMLEKKKNLDPEQPAEAQAPSPSSPNE